MSERTYELLEVADGAPVKAWTRGVPFEDEARRQLENTARWLTVSGFAFTAGLLIFCGSLYLLSVTGQRWLGAITPVGGLAFLVGWATLACWAVGGARVP